MNGFLKVLGLGKGQTQGQPVDPATAPPPKYNPLWMNAEAYDQGVQDRTVRQGQMQANGINSLIAGGDLEGARTKALGYGNTAAVTQIDAMLDKMTERQLAEAKRYGGIIAGTLQPLLDVPEADRPQYEERVKARLLAQGVPEKMLAGLDLTDYGIQSELNIALGLEKRMEGRAFTEMGDQLVLSDTATGSANSVLTRDPAYAEVTTRTNNEVTAAETARANRADEAVAWKNAETSRMNAQSGAGGQGGGSRILTPEELATFGYPPGTIVQVNAKGDHMVRHKPGAEYSGGEIKAFRDNYRVLTQFSNTLADYRAAVKENGIQPFGNESDPQVAKMNALKQSLVFQAKDLLKLGILSKDDYENLDRMIPGATGMGAILKNPDSFEESIKPLDAMISSQMAMIPEEYRGTAAKPAKADDGSGIAEDVRAIMRKYLGE